MRMLVEKALIEAIKTKKGRLFNKHKQQRDLGQTHRIHTKAIQQLFLCVSTLHQTHAGKEYVQVRYVSC